MEFLPDILLIIQEKLEEKYFQEYKKIFGREPKALKTNIYRLQKSETKDILDLLKAKGYEISATSAQSVFYKKFIQAKNNKGKNIFIKVSDDIFAQDWFYNFLGYKDLNDFLIKISHNFPKDLFQTQCYKLKANCFSIEQKERAWYEGAYLLYHQTADDVRIQILRIQKTPDNKIKITISKQKEILFKSIEAWTEKEDKIINIFFKGDDHNPLVKIYLKRGEPFHFASYTTFDKNLAKFENGYLLLVKPKKDINKTTRHLVKKFYSYLLQHLNKQHQLSLSLKDLTELYQKSGLKIDELLFNIFLEKDKKIIKGEIKIIVIGHRWIYSYTSINGENYKGHIYERIKQRKLVQYNNQKNKQFNIYLPDSSERIIFGIATSVSSLGQIEVAQCILISKKEKDFIEKNINDIRLMLYNQRFFLLLKSLNYLTVIPKTEIIQDFIGNNTIILISSSDLALHLCPLKIKEDLTFELDFNKIPYTGNFSILDGKLIMNITSPTPITMYVQKFDNYIIGFYAGINNDRIFTIGKLAIIKQSNNDYESLSIFDERLKTLVSQHPKIIEFFKNSTFPNFKSDNHKVYIELDKLLSTMNEL